MALLILGILLFTCVHLIPSLAPNLRAQWRTRLGEGVYRGLFSLAVLAGIVLTVLGWRSMDPVYLYTPYPALRHPAMGLLLLAFLLLVVSKRKSRLRLWLRHPQLTGVLLWAGAHLLLNGDNRSLLLFGCLAVWTVVEMFAINRREGVWVRGTAPSWGSEFVTLLITVVVVGVVIYIHPWISGMPIMPR
ncbi:MAG: NnrU protein [Halioglobus sp.]|nr:NnrU protein [Halioglobus sp.]